jgi:hypothetical protein
MVLGGWPAAPIYVLAHALFTALKVQLVATSVVICDVYGDLFHKSCLFKPILFRFGLRRGSIMCYCYCPQGMFLFFLCFELTS